MGNNILSIFNFSIFNNIQLINTFIIHIIIILFAIVLSGFFERDKVKDNILQGIIIGLLTGILINIPVVLSSGSYYDAKTVLFTLSGYFFGPVTTLVTVIVGLIVRLIVPETGSSLVSILTIVNSAVGGYILSLLFRNKQRKIKKVYKYTILTYIINISNIVIFLIFSITGTTFKQLIAPYLVVFPIVTIFACWFLDMNINYSKVIKESTIQRHLLKSSVDSIEKLGIVTLDKNYNYLVFNKTHEYYVNNYLNKEVKVGDNYLEIFEDANLTHDYASIFKRVFDGNDLCNKYSFEHKDTKLYFNQEYNSVYDKNKIVAINIITRDVTDQMEFEEEMINLSYRDPLTGLFNRRSLTHQIKLMNDVENLVVVFFDIDGLKFMNDAFGHEDGDKLIVLISTEIKNAIPENSLVFRLGGDEFVVIIKDVTLSEGKRIAKRISINLSKQKINEIEISLSYGVANKLKNEDLEETIKRSENFMYDNKILFSRDNHTKNIDGILKALLEIDLKMEQHISNVFRYCNMIADEIKMDEHNKKLLKPYVLLHDIGKISIDKELVAKDQFENEEEFHEMKKHVEIGYRILSRVPEYFEIAFDVLTQYENFDGTGFPKQLKGRNIPIKARILRVANYFDFKVNYEKVDQEIVINNIKNDAGKKFDPIIAKAFVEAINK